MQLASFISFQFLLMQSAKNMQPKPGIILFKLPFVTYLRHVIILSDYRIYVHISESVIYRGTY